MINIELGRNSISNNTFHLSLIPQIIFSITQILSHKLFVQLSLIPKTPSRA